MTIRECVISDSEGISRINRSALGYDYPPDKTGERLKKLLALTTHRIYVACVDGKVVGYVHACDYDCIYTDPLKNILGLAVEEAYRGRGIGKALLAAAEDWAKECGCRGVRLVSGAERTGAHQFYLRCGYENRKQQKNFIKLLAPHAKKDPI